MKLDNNLYKLTVSATLVLATAVTGCGQKQSGSVAPKAVPTAEAAPQAQTQAQAAGSPSVSVSMTATKNGEVDSRLNGLKTARNVGAAAVGASAAVAIAAKLERSYHGLEKLFSSIETGSLQFSDSMIDARKAVTGLKSEVSRHKAEIEALLGPEYVKARAEFFSAKDVLDATPKSTAIVSAEAAVVNAQAQVDTSESALKTFLSANKASGPGTRANEIAAQAKVLEDAIQSAKGRVDLAQEALVAAQKSEIVTNSSARLTRELSESVLESSEKTMSEIRNTMNKFDAYKLSQAEQKLLAAERILGEKTAFLNRTSMMFAEEFGVLLSSKFVGRGAARVKSFITQPEMMNKIQTVGVVGGVLSLAFTTGMILEISTDDAGSTKASLIEKYNDNHRSVLDSVNSQY